MNAQSLAVALRRLMDVLYDACVIVAGIALVLISAVIPWAVYTRYVLNRAASWPEPMAVLLMIVLTFFGAAACYRVGLHMRVGFFVSLLPARLQRAIALFVEGLMALIALFMINWGIKLVAATWQNSIADFPSLSVGVTYLPIPIGGAILLLFVFERLAIGPLPLPARPSTREARWIFLSSSPPCWPASSSACRSPIPSHWLRSPAPSGWAFRSKR
jgi:TRAP-type C4-dicarboxylate transport system permease small subunit